MIQPLVTLFMGASLVTAVADAVPKLDIEKTCSAASRSGAAGNDQAATNGCLRSEREARDDLGKRWSSFSAAAKRQCTEETRIGGNFPSYVELITCLELATGNFPAQGGNQGAPAAPGMPAARGKGR